MGSLSRILWLGETRLSQSYYVWIELGISIILQGKIIYLFNKYKHTQFHEQSNPFNYKILTVVCIILSFVFHPGSKNEWYFSK